MIELRVGARNDGKRTVEIYVEKWDVDLDSETFLETLDGGRRLMSATSLTRSLENSKQFQDAVAEIFNVAGDAVREVMRELRANGYENITEDPVWQASFYSDL